VGKLSNLLILATIAIILALLFYTTGVWAEKTSKILKSWHTVTFWIGLLFDTTGTLLMERINKAGVPPVSDFSASLHGLAGASAIILMAFHAIWATIVLLKRDEKKNQSFHRLSLVV
jgi:uncharacterized repeat protein (TIGR03987 family)